MKNSCNEFHKNPTDSLVADINSQTDKRVLHVMLFVLYGEDIKTQFLVENIFEVIRLLLFRSSRILSRFAKRKISLLWSQISYKTTVIILSVVSLQVLRTHLVTSCCDLSLQHSCNELPILVNAQILQVITSVNHTSGIGRKLHNRHGICYRVTLCKNTVSEA